MTAGVVAMLMGACGVSSGLVEGRICCCGVLNADCGPMNWLGGAPVNGANDIYGFG